MLKKRTSELRSSSGQRVLVTRAAEQASALTEALVDIGVEPVVVSTITIVPPPTFAALDLAISELEQIDYLVLTSVNAVTAFFDRLTVQGRDVTTLANLKIVAVGPKSAEAIAAHGVVADLIPKSYRAEGVVALLKERVANKRVLYPRAALARDLIPAELTAAGAIVNDPVAYTSVPPAEAAEKLQKALADGLDLLTFTASSTVHNFADLLDSAKLAEAKQVPVASIGPLTTATAKELGFNVVVEPEQSTLDAFVETIKKYFEEL